MVRENHMKKIIALAVAGAFAAPVMAADVTLTGDVEFAFKSQGDNMDFVNGDRDFKIVASEEINGLSVTATLDMEDGDLAGGSADTDLKIAGSFGYLEVGHSGSASGKFDEVADVAEAGAGTTLTDGYSEDGYILFSPNLGIEGLSVAVSYGVDNSTSANTAGTIAATGTPTAGVSYAASTAAANSTESVAYAIQYEVAGIKIAHGSEKPEGAALRTSVTSVSGSFGPVYIGYEMLTNNDQAAAGDWTNIGATYDYGMGKLFVEQNAKDNGTTTTAYGASYKVGSTLNTYVSIEDSDDASIDSATYVGVEYAF
jgi:hypothetical protein